jgi:flagellar basal body-associated protein FliL
MTPSPSSKAIIIIIIMLVILLCQISFTTLFMRISCMHILLAFGSHHRQDYEADVLCTDSKKIQIPSDIPKVNLVSFFF